MSYITNFTAIDTLFQSSPLVIIMPYFRLPERRFEFFMVMFFATEEINKNPYVLPNMSLFFVTIIELCKDTLGVLNVYYSPKNYTRNVINYSCHEYAFCDVDLTGPSWQTTLKLTIQSRTPKVRMCDTE